MLTIIMYHYVRDVAQTRYPHMKVLSPADFSGQLDYFGKHYTVIAPQELFDAIEHRRPLPPDGLLLTFDDGYTDHFDTVRPELKARGLSGAFFPIGNVLLEHKLPNFNKVHFILGRGEDIGTLNGRLADLIDRYRKIHDLKHIAEYRKAYAQANHLDDAETLFFKRMLQVGLSDPARGLILNDLFRAIVGQDEEETRRALYMSFEQLEEMIVDGMYVGSHGYSHAWMDSLSAAEQARDVDISIDILAKIPGCDPRRMFCYPYGGHNESLLRVLRDRKFAAALTVEVRLADLAKDDPLRLSRLDTIHLPFCGDAPVHDWTRRATGVTASH